jgi:hypothetical protein
MALDIIEKVYDRTTQCKINAEDIIKRNPITAFRSFIERLKFELEKC